MCGNFIYFFFFLFFGVVNCVSAENFLLYCIVDSNIVRCDSKLNEAAMSFKVWYQRKKTLTSNIISSHVNFRNGLVLWRRKVKNILFIRCWRDNNWTIENCQEGRIFNFIFKFKEEVPKKRKKSSINANVKCTVQNSAEFHRTSDRDGLIRYLNGWYPRAMYKWWGKAHNLGIVLFNK